MNNVMKIERIKRILEVVALIVTAVIILIQFTGCQGGSTQDRVEEVDAAFRKGNSSFSALTGFIAPLEEFDFENTEFLTNILAALQQSRTAVEETNASLDELQGFDYKGELEQLGAYIEDYIFSTREALSEVEGVYTGLEDILRAVQPALEEEAVVTQLEAPASNEEWLERLYGLDAALEPSMRDLQEVEVVPFLQEYKAYMVDLFGTLQKMVKEIIPVAAGTTPNVNMDENPDFLHIQDLRSQYPQLVDGMYDNLKISRIDLLVEEVELEINRLYLGEKE
jgi:hypothetical protein